jgi:hypothetical protein
MYVGYESDEKKLTRLEEANPGQTVLVYGRGSAKLVTELLSERNDVARRVLVTIETGEIQFWDSDTMVAPVEAVMTIKE